MNRSISRSPAAESPSADLSAAETASPDLPTALEQENRELAILNAIATALNASVDLSTSLSTTLSRVAELLQLRTGWVWLLDERTEAPYLAAAENLPPALADHPERMAGGCHCLTEFRRNPGQGAANVVTCSRLEWLTEEADGLRFHASIPLRARGRRLGVMNVASNEWRELSPAELRLLRIIGEMLGIAIERSRLFERSAEAGATEERNRLAREIHDTLAQGLAASALQLETAEALLDGREEAARVKAAVRQALELTRQSLEDARRSVLDLRPAPLNGLSLHQALEELCRQASGAGKPDVRHETVGGERPLPPRLEAGLYRVAQEAVNNALRHADAATIVVRIALHAEQVRLTISDDGRGFDAEADCGGCSEPTDRFGIVGMCERVRLLAGDFRLRSSPGEGTAVEAVVPIS